MQNEIIQSMHDRVRAIYRAFTGEEVAEGEAGAETTEDTDEDITRRFAELEAVAQAFPAVMERVSPFTFMPPVDVIAAEGAVVIEVALPGVERDAITVERVPGALVISGIRPDSRALAGTLFHAEIPRGPFYRSIPLAFPIEREPRIELERGVLRIYLTLAAAISHEGSAGNSNSQRKQTESGGGT
jgi:HSP20 family molecular chaperone IbpA